MRFVFIRNDDVRNELDNSLVNITDLCLKYGACISHAVEPANVSTEVINWLKSIKHSFPSFIEIIQHGYDHNIKMKYPYGYEFGGDRNFESQYLDLRAGLELMDDYFGNQWERIITFPYGAFNHDTLKAVNKLGYIALSSSVSFNLKRRILDNFGQLLNFDFLFGKKISYHGTRRSNFNFLEFDVSVNIILKYTGYRSAIHYDITNVINQIERGFRYTNIVGILLHHRVHNEHVSLIEEILKYCISKNYKFISLKELIKSHK